MRRKLAILSATCGALFAFGGVAAGNAFALEFTAHNTGYTSAAVGKSVLAIPGVGSVECEEGTDVGNTGNGVAGTSTVTFEKCKEPALLGACQSGAVAGTIETNTLHTDLVWIEKAAEEFGIIFTQNGTEPIAEFECGGVQFEVYGNVRGKITEPANPALGVLVNKFTIDVNPAEVNGQNLYTSINGGAGLESTEDTTDVVTLNGGVEGEFK